MKFRTVAVIKYPTATITYATSQAKVKAEKPGSLKAFAARKGIR